MRDQELTGRLGKMSIMTAADDTTDTTDTDYRRTDQWGSDWLEHDIITARKKCKQCHAATRCADCCFLCENRCDQYRVCEVVKQYAVDAAPYDPSTEQLIDAFRDLQQDRSMRSRIKNLNDYTYKPVVKESIKNESDLSAQDCEPVPVPHACSGTLKRQDAVSTLPAEIYMLPCTYTGLYAEIDNCDPPAIVVRVGHAFTPMSDGCIERYRTADGYLVDCSIDSVDFGDWFGQELKEEES